MNRNYLLALAFFAVFLGCSTQSDKDVQSSGPAVQAVKPVLIIEDVTYIDSNPVTEALGNAFYDSMYGLLQRMNLYQVVLPSDEDALERALQPDNRVVSRVYLKGAELVLEAEVWDAHKDQVITNIERRTRDFLETFRLSEGLTEELTSQFYGSHVSFGKLQFLMDTEGMELLVDGLPFLLDDENTVEILSGNHILTLLETGTDQVLKEFPLDVAKNRFTYVRLVDRKGTPLPSIYNLPARWKVEHWLQEYKIGISLNNLDDYRWSRDEKILRELFESEECEVITKDAGNNAELQNTQIGELVDAECDVILIIAQNSTTAVPAVDKASEAGVKIIAYDRLIKSSNVDCYITFNNEEVGRIQALGVISEVDSGRFVLMGGAPSDNNAVQFRKGQMDILQPLINKGQIEVVGDVWVENWAPVTATRKMAKLLEENSNQIDAVVASNDGTALGALQALRAQGLAGQIPISGQDATAEGCISILKGELTLTVLKDIRKLSPLTVKIAMQLAMDESIQGLTSYSLSELTGEDLTGSIPCKFIEVTSVGPEDVYDAVILSGYQDYDRVYSSISEDLRPPRP